MSHSVGLPPQKKASEKIKKNEKHTNGSQRRGMEKDRQRERERERGRQTTTTTTEVHPGTMQISH